MDDNEASAKRRQRKGPPPPPRPLEAESLQALALHYAARFATTSLKLRRYLQRKLRERPWNGDAAPDLDGLVARLVRLGYVDDAGWAVIKRREMAARGLGPRRVSQALMAAGVGDEAPDQVANAEAAVEPPVAAAIRFARRRRFGPFRREDASDDPAAQKKALAAMLRAGHSFDVARRVLAARNEAEAEALLEDWPC